MMIFKSLIRNFKTYSFNSNFKKRSQYSTPKEIGLTFGKFVLIAEVGIFIGSYLVWKRMNDSQDFRHYMSRKFPSILEGFYQIGEQLVLLEPGEIYFEDYLVYYFELNSPFGEQRQKKIHKGNLKICSKSFVFDPLNISYPLIKFSYKSIEKIQVFNEDNDLENDSIYSPTSSKLDTTLKQKCFAISAKQTVCCKANNKIGPYTIQKREKSNDLHYFQFIFTNCSDSLDLLLQLHRASTLNYEQEDLMLQLILNSRLSRDKFKLELHQMEDATKEHIQLECSVNKINPLVTNPGKLILTNMCIYYKPFNNLSDSSSLLQETNLFKIKLKQIKYVIERRYHLKKVGLEIQFLDFNDLDSEQNYSKRLPYLYVTFYDEKQRNLFYNKLVMEQRDKLVNFEEFSQENMLQKWRYSAISNYEYLMYLNNISDRSFNDLTQYPIFPWVLNDYTSQVLDLSDPTVYRDLSKPIGALNPDRLSRLKQRSQEVQAETSTPSFLYGSHYSTPAFVLFYLVRQQPEWQLCLQNGKFDHPNRLFYSIADTWRNCLNIDSDVKELIPEFYDTTSQPTFLRNHLELDLGVRQDGIRVNHVVLPKWANNSPREFIQKMRDALESSYVSENLHKWIDLIWGYKQNGIEAHKADNLFYYICYEGAVDLDAISDYSERKSLEIQIQEFGQIPTQLFQKAHLPKSKQLTNEMDITVNDLDINIEKTENKISTSQVMSPIASTKINPFKICPLNFKILDVKLTSKVHKSQINELIFVDYQQDKLPLICSVSSDNWIKIFSLEDRSIFRSHNESNFSISSVDYLQTGSDSSSSYKSLLLFLSCWDNSVYVYDMNYNRCVYSLEDAHDDAISRIRLVQTSSSNIYILTSSWDSLIKIWRLNENFTNSIKLQFVSELSHDSSIVTFDINDSYLASVCDDGSLHLYKINTIQDTSSKNDSDYLTKVKLDNELDKDNLFSLLYLINPKSEDFEKITDCKMYKSNIDSIDTIAFCTSIGYVKIYNIKTNTEIFSLKITQGSRLNKLLYYHDYIITCDTNGFVYFVDLQSQAMENAQEIQTLRQRSNSMTSNTTSFLAKTLKISDSSLDSIEIYKDSIICVSDADGNIHVLSLLDI
ncbi:unnamed protein product [Brachionus calyciflorus]|uniref:FAN n=1 Tax=Brachionus calyciflorus TaxID=104777 RepID=A0A813ZRQ6_9BILA|nr:unnamed protein product [Brachionus calyciflorus]